MVQDITAKIKSKPKKKTIIHTKNTVFCDHRFGVTMKLNFFSRSDEINFLSVWISYQSNKVSIAIL